ncbi:hypothetical protein, partial [Megasphaera elsdenii]|uniref:hypothetical protein n=1 Tax=Megasphaera elsdenii TaxID=907 RepID=UPI0022DF6380
IGEVAQRAGEVEFPRGDLKTTSQGSKKKALSHEDNAFLSLKFEVESLMWMEQNLKAIASNIIHQTSNI